SGWERNVSSASAWWALRSRLAIWAIVLFSVLLVTAGVLTGLQAHEDEHDRNAHQAEAEETFLSQPDRHPHRMVHYGHYAFRAPAPLAVIDPGLDTVTGQSIFLEGHRQNSASFDDATASADFGGLSWLSPARVYQLLAPLLLILVGFGAVVRERESSTLATLMLQGVSGPALLAGKLAALVTLTVLLLLPLFITASLSESAAAGVTITATYLLYLGAWAAFTIVASAVLRKRSSVLVALTAAWLVTCLLVPSIAVDAEARSTAHVGKIESDLRLLTDLRKLGDGHNANDPAFARLRDSLFAKYDVSDPADLPVNLRGVVAAYSEAELTETMNRYAEERMTVEANQSQRLSRIGWLSPALAVGFSSRVIAGTDISHYHRFLRETEALRFDFVQGLNKAHAEVLDYTLDMNRNNSEEDGRRARISSDTWAVLDEYRFTPATINERWHRAVPTLAMLATWLLLSVAGIWVSGRRLKP
ncbi:MAG: DUF3526 domain-containing protein, partial [Pseudomonadota bacterium]